MIWRRRKADRRRKALVAELTMIQSSLPDALDRRYVGDMILYAEVGRDRLRLPDDYVDRVRAQLVNHARFRREARKGV